ncbi:hypothetical protein JTB14_008623 [Gonioctena quinquepunctata]|nr:hypothetical protein JTB14_008623 [Gonioctena quinquepunctata]
MNFCSATAMVSMCQLVTKFPVPYYASLYSGQSICAIIAALLQMLLMSTRMSPESNGTAYFGFGTLAMFSAVMVYININMKSKYFIYRVNCTENKSLKNILSMERKRIASGFKKIKWYYATLIFVQGTTAMIVPGFTALVVSENANNENMSVWEDIYFSPVTSYLIFHTCNLIGRETAKIFKTPKHAAIILTLAIVRIVMVPMMIFCNAQPRNHLQCFLETNGTLGLFLFLDSLKEFCSISVFWPYLRLLIRTKLRSSCF